MNQIQVIPPGIKGFDYSTLDDPDLAAEARAAAGRINGRIRTAQDEIGRELITMKKKMPGAFGAWIVAEFGFTERTAQNYMSRAKFIEGKSETVSLLPPAALYALAAPTASPEAVQEVVDQVDAGVRLTTTMIRDKLAGAKAITQKQVDIGRLKKAREAEKRRRGEIEAQQLKWKEDQKVKKECVQNAAKFLVSKLGCSGVLELFRLLGDAEISSLGSQFHTGDWSRGGGPRLLTETEIEAKFGGGGAP